MVDIHTNEMYKYFRQNLTHIRQTDDMLTFGVKVTWILKKMVSQKLL